MTSPSPLLAVQRARAPQMAAIKAGGTLASIVAAFKNYVPGTCLPSSGDFYSFLVRALTTCGTSSSHALTTLVDSGDEQLSYTRSIFIYRYIGRSVFACLWDLFQSKVIRNQSGRSTHPDWEYMYIWERQEKNREKSFLYFAGCLRRNALNRSSVSRFCLVPSRNSRKKVLQWQERE